MQAIELLIENEKLVSRLYAIYADKFIELRDFWVKKVVQENTHAELLEGIWSISQEIPSFFEEGRFSKEAIEMEASLVKDSIQKSKNCSLIEALAAAGEIENGLIERSFFKVMPGDSNFVQDAFAKIEQDTKKHREEIQELRLKYAAKPTC